MPFEMHFGGAHMHTWKSYTNKSYDDFECVMLMKKEEEKNKINNRLTLRMKMIDGHNGV